MTTEQQLLFNVIRILDFTSYRFICSAQEEMLFQQIEKYLLENNITDFRLPGAEKMFNKEIEDLFK